MKKQVIELQLNKVFPNPDQPRKHFDQDRLDELAMSIREYGVQEPIKVVPREGRYMIVMGERRWRASELAGKSTIPSIIENLNAHQVEELALLENIQREDLNIIEQGKAYQRLIDRGWTVEDMARKFGYKKTGPIYDRLSLLSLAADYQDMVIKGSLTPAQAYEMSRLPQAQQDIVFAKIRSGELNTQNKLYAFVTALIAIDSQESIFALTPLSSQESESIMAFSGLMGSIEKFLKQIHQEDRLRHLEKAVLHTDISTERLDLIIGQLQKIRRTILVGEGVQKAQEIAA
jgi:ParB/RepB/Spo0J family partition protein